MLLAASDGGSQEAQTHPQSIAPYCLGFSGPCPNRKDVRPGRLPIPASSLRSVHCRKQTHRPEQAEGGDPKPLEHVLHSVVPASFWPLPGEAPCTQAEPLCLLVIHLPAGTAHPWSGSLASS